MWVEFSCKSFGHKFLVLNYWALAQGASRCTLAFTGHGPVTDAVALHFLKPVALGTLVLDVGASGVTLPSVVASSLVSRMDYSSSSSSCNEKWKLFEFFS